MDAGIKTIGFAGCFGFFMEYVPVGQEHGGAQCPVRLTPGITIAETVHGGAAKRHVSAHRVSRLAGRSVSGSR